MNVARPHVASVWRFALAGAFGFVVEFIVVGLLAGNGWPPLFARAVSFPLASLLTWLINRQLTFRDVRALDMSGAVREYSRYFSGQLAGALTNVLVYTLLVLTLPAVGALTALSAGAAFGLIVNFYLAQTWIFRGGGERDQV